VQLNNFIHKNTGITCKLCTFNKFSQDKKGVFEDFHRQEFSVIKGLQHFCQEFEFKFCNEGCLADFAIRPKNTATEAWLPLQLKTTQKVCHGLYRFHIHNDYKDLNIIFFGMDKQRVWIINYADLKGRKTLSIGEKSSERTNETYLLKKIRILN